MMLVVCFFGLVIDSSELVVVELVLVRPTAVVGACLNCFSTKHGEEKLIRILVSTW